MNVIHTETSDFKKPLTSYKITVGLKGIDDWLKSNMRLPNYLYGIKDGITTILMADVPAVVSFSDGSTVAVNTVAEVMDHMGPDLIDITIGTQVINKDDYSELTAELPPNVLSLLLIGSMLMFNTLENSLDRSIYFRSGGYPQEIYPIMLEDIRTIDELLGISLADIAWRYHRSTTNVSVEELNKSLKAHTNYNMLRYHVQSVMAEIRAVEIGIDVPDTMWEITIEHGQLYIMYMGNPHMYRLLAAKTSLSIEEDNDVDENPNPYGLPHV